MPSVYLAIGHGKRADGTFDPGAVDPDSGVSEYFLARRIVTVATEHLRAMHVDVESEADAPSGTDGAEDVNHDHIVSGQRLAVVTLHFDGEKTVPAAVIGHGNGASDHLSEAIGQAWGTNYLPFHGVVGRSELLAAAFPATPIAEVIAGPLGPYSSDELAAMGKAVAEGIYAFAHSEFAPRFPVAATGDAGATDSAAGTVQPATPHPGSAGGATAAESEVPTVPQPSPGDEPPAPTDDEESGGGQSEEEEETDENVEAWKMTFGVGTETIDQRDHNLTRLEMLAVVNEWFEFSEAPDSWATVRRSLS